MRLEITAERLSIRSTDGDADYPIRNRTSTREGSANLTVEIPQAGEEWQFPLTVIGERFLIFTGESATSGTVWEKV
jgi:hypothetical protein